MKSCKQTMKKQSSKNSETGFLRAGSVTNSVIVTWTRQSTRASAAVYRTSNFNYKNTVTTNDSWHQTANYERWFSSDDNRPQENSDINGRLSKIQSSWSWGGPWQHVTRQAIESNLDSLLQHSGGFILATLPATLINETQTGRQRDICMKRSRKKWNISENCRSLFILPQENNGLVRSASRISVLIIEIDERFIKFCMIDEFSPLQAR